MALPSLRELKSVHIIGVCGTLMGAFATFLKRRGVYVTGSDQNIYPPMRDILRDGGIELFSGYKAENLANLPKKPDLIVIGNVISRINPEAQAALGGDYAYCSLPEAMESLLLQNTKNIVVAGTHGKTTTSSLLSHVLCQAGKDPSYFIGGVTFDLPYSFHVSKIDSGQPFVLEGDEYDTAFWDKVPKFNHYLPDEAILTSIEYDHADIYPDLASVERAFEGLAKRIRANGALIACTDFECVQKLLKRAPWPSGTEILTYGGPGARFHAEKIQTQGTLTAFEITDSGKRVAELKLALPGRHNVMNALAVWIECQRLKVPEQALQKAFESFRGVKRRQEERGQVNGVLVIDDFAHHPTAVRETLRALHAKYPNRRLVAVFEPRSATSRRKVFQREYAEAFDEAARVFIAKPYDQSRIDSSDQFSSEQLIDDITRRGRTASLFETVDAGVDAVAHQSKPGDLIAVLSNGGFGGFIPKLLERLA